MECYAILRLTVGTYDFKSLCIYAITLILAKIKIFNSTKMFASPFLIIYIYSHKKYIKKI